jgi:choline kinase
VKGIVLAAGGGTRLRPDTDDLPKTLLSVGDRSVLEVILGNLAAVGVEHVTLITGHAAHAIEAMHGELERGSGCTVELLHNPRYDELNNAYSVWLARELFTDEGVLLVNGDTLHPPAVERSLLAARGPGVLLAVDTVKPLAEEEMKVALDDDGHVASITKLMPAADADGEYIGVTLIEGAAREPLADVLQRTFERDPQAYYEDAYQLLADEGFPVGVADIGEVEWVEIDDHRDLGRARSLTW